jgi:hypothetical protein
VNLNETAAVLCDAESLPATNASDYTGSECQPFTDLFAALPLAIASSPSVMANQAGSGRSGA